MGLNEFLLIADIQGDRGEVWGEVFRG